MKLLVLCFCISATVLVGNVSSHPQSQFLGGYTSIPADSEKVRQLALFSLGSVTQQSGSPRPLGLVRVVSAKSQIVSGTNYNINLVACEKDADFTDDGYNSAVDEQSCRYCDVTIWEQPWLNQKSVTDVSCSEPSELAVFFPGNNIF